jgi:hypothetical protein
VLDLVDAGGRLRDRALRSGRRRQRKTATSATPVSATTSSDLRTIAL